MPLTDHSDVFASFHEDGFNLIIKHLMRQRPSMFNYATENLTDFRSPYFPQVGKEVCKKIHFHPAVKNHGNPLVTSEPYMPIIGYRGSYGISYCFQLSKLEIDFHPSNIISLPPELEPPLDNQQIALRGKVCAGMGCPDDDSIKITGINPTGGKRGNDSPAESPKQPFQFEKLICFCLDLCAVLRIIRNNGFIELRLIKLELKEIKPNGLESALECYISTVFKLTILPKLRIALNDLVFDLNRFITFSPTPISSDVPFNPSIGDERLSVFINLS